MKKSDHKPLPEGAIISQPFKKKRGFKLPGAKLVPKRAKIGLLVVLVLAIAGAAAFIVQRDKNTPISQTDTLTPEYIMSDKDYAELQAHNLKAAAPKTDAPNDQKIAYYNELIISEFDAENYEAVVSDYKKVVQVTQDTDLPFNSYVAAARAYAKQGDTKTASTVLSRAEMAVQRTTKDSELRAAFLATIATTRKEIAP